MLRSKPSWQDEGCFIVHVSGAARASYAGLGGKLTDHFLNRKIQVTGVIKKIAPDGNLRAVLPVSSPESLRILTAPKPVSKSGMPKPEFLRVSELVSRRVDLYLRDRRILGDVTITAIEVGSEPETLLTLKAKIGDLRSRLYKARTIEDIAVDGVRLSLKYDRDEDVLAVNEKDRKDRKDAAEADRLRLAAVNKELWARLSDEQNEDWTERHRAFAETVQDKFPQLNMRVAETKYFLFLTDIPASEVNTYIDYLDRMYLEMCRAYGIPEGYNIWCGKCVVVAFEEQRDFIRFEVEMMKNTGNPSESVGYCHNRDDGRVVISLFSGDRPSRFGSTLVHETAYGLTARYLSNVDVPAWLNDGMAVWIADYIVSQDSTLERSQRRAVAALQKQKTLAGFFDAPQTSDDRYGTAAAMVQILLEIDKQKFSRFVRDIKLGFTQKAALDRNFGLTLGQLTSEYGRRIGIPSLRH